MAHEVLQTCTDVPNRFVTLADGPDAMLPTWRLWPSTAIGSKHGVFGFLECVRRALFFKREETERSRGDLRVGHGRRRHQPLYDRLPRAGRGVGTI